MPTKFENCPIILKPQVKITDSFEDIFIMANSITINDQLPIAQIRRLGREGAYAGRAESPVQGQLSIDFVYGEMSVFVDGVKIYSPSKSWFDNLTGKVEYIDAFIGPYQFSSGLLTDFSFSSEPNSIVNTSIGFVFYNSELSKLDSPVIEQQYFSGVGHGVYSSGDFSDPTIGSNQNSFSFSYNLSQGFEPVRYAGQVSPAIIKRTDGEITFNIQGDDLANGLTTSPDSLCKDRINEANFFITGLCNNNFGDKYTVKGYIQDREISIVEGDIVRGSLKIIDYF